MCMAAPEQELTGKSAISLGRFLQGQPPESAAAGIYSGRGEKSLCACHACKCKVGEISANAR
jgi:hypothetical protein